MIYKQKVRIESHTEIIEHQISSCVKCNCDEIIISEYEDQFGFISTASCKNCGNKVQVKAVESAVIKEWNNNNDIESLIHQKQMLILKSRSEINELIDLQKARKKRKAHAEPTRTAKK